jgi:hypothetical protein
VHDYLEFLNRTGISGLYSVSSSQIVKSIMAEIIPGLNSTCFCRGIHVEIKKSGRGVAIVFFNHQCNGSGLPRQGIYRDAI